MNGKNKKNNIAPQNPSLCPRLGFFLLPTGFVCDLAITVLALFVIPILRNNI
ncbi:hypothetical protein [Psychrobacter lutiphocae]|uniref:hypothetical protein n=1 Tax=Psychrobacter lutiphocae TaxID=540500 RepID=UPI000361323A|nr:hypothetical protein [Psychrobacter lutiphocae]